MSKAYTLEDIDRMRMAIRSMRDAPMIVEGSRSIPANESAQIEEEIRTYMAAGVGPEELERRASEMRQRYLEARERREDHYRQKEAEIFRAHDMVKTKFGGTPRPKTSWSGNRDCGSCRYYSQAMAGRYWDRCEHPSLETKVTQEGPGQTTHERPRCQEQRSLLGKCGASGRLFETAQIGNAEALWIAAQLSFDAIRILAYRGGYLGNSLRNYNPEACEELDELGLLDHGPLSRPIVQIMLDYAAGKIEAIETAINGPRAEPPPLRERNFWERLFGWPPY